MAIQAIPPAAFMKPDMFSLSQRLEVRRPPMLNLEMNKSARQQFNWRFNIQVEIYKPKIKFPETLVQSSNALRDSILIFLKEAKSFKESRKNFFFTILQNQVCAWVTELAHNAENSIPADQNSTQDIAKFNEMYITFGFLFVFWLYPLSATFRQMMILFFTRCVI